ncbi:MAG: hypothetical protein MI924_15330 [Chloroflexales bacterium]|nr:hypothetical protein [Chloroflexales bacterium]
MLLDRRIDDLVRQLRRAGLRPSERLVQSILEYGDAAREALLELATDTLALQEDEPIGWGPLHALRLLGEIPDQSIIIPLLSRLPLQVAGQDDYPSHTWANEAPQIVGRCGAAAAPILWSFADDAMQLLASRGAALHGLTYVATTAPELREDIITEARNRLAQETNPEMAAYLVLLLGELGVSAAYAEIMAAYREGRIDREIIPPADARQLLLGEGNPHLGCVGRSFWERYDLHGPNPTPQ